MIKCGMGSRLANFPEIIFRNGILILLIVTAYVSSFTIILITRSRSRSKIVFLEQIWLWLTKFPKDRTDNYNIREFKQPRTMTTESFTGYSFLLPGWLYSKQTNKFKEKKLEELVSCRLFVTELLSEAFTKYLHIVLLWFSWA